MSSERYIYLAVSMKPLRNGACSLQCLELLLCNAQSRPIGILAELVLSQQIFVMDLIVSPPDRPDLKQTVHAFERNTLRLGDQEEDEEDGQDHHRSEEEVDSTSVAAHGQEHLGRKAADDEVPEPIVGRRRRLTQRTHALIEDLRVEDPWSAVP